MFHFMAYSDEEYFSNILYILGGIVSLVYHACFSWSLNGQGMRYILHCFMKKTDDQACGPYELKSSQVAIVREEANFSRWRALCVLSWIFSVLTECRLNRVLSLVPVSLHDWLLTTAILLPNLYLKWPKGRDSGRLGSACGKKPERCRKFGLHCSVLA